MLASSQFTEGGKFRAMPQSLVQIYLHVIFSTKDRAPFLQDKSFRESLHAYLAGILNGLESTALIVGGVADHVHLLCRLGKQMEVSNLIRDVKRDSSTWVKHESPSLADFYWQRGYGAFSISPSHVPGLTRYIQDQEQHHKRESFQDEFRRICGKYGVSIDERYVWD
jgi:REP element-mobilizing transposase RayT